MYKDFGVVSDHFLICFLYREIPIKQVSFELVNDKGCEINVPMTMIVECDIDKGFGYLQLIICYNAEVWLFKNVDAELGQNYFA